MARLAWVGLSACIGCAPTVAEAPRPVRRAPVAAEVPPRLEPPPAPATKEPPIPAFPTRWNGDTGSEGALLVRFDTEATFRAVGSCQIGEPRIVGVEEPFGHVPLFSLYEDGSVIVVRTEADRSERVVRAQIGAGGAQAFVEDLLALGLERVESHTDDCAPRESGRDFCLADANMLVLEVRLPSGKQKQLHNYAGMAKEQAALDAVLARIDGFRDESERDYLPSWSTLFVQRCDGIEGPAWPLAPEVLTPPPDAPTTWAVRVPGEANRALYGGRAALGTVVGFRHEGHGYGVFLVPSLPGADAGAPAKWRQRRD